MQPPRRVGRCLPPPPGRRCPIPRTQQRQQARGGGGGSHYGRAQRRCVQVLVRGVGAPMHISRRRGLHKHHPRSPPFQHPLRVSGRFVGPCSFASRWWWWWWGRGGGSHHRLHSPPPPKPPPAPGRGFLHPSQRPALRHDGRRCARAPGCQPPSRALGRAAPALPPQRPRAVGGGGRGGWGGALGAGDPPCLRGSVKTAATGATARPVAASAPPIGAQWSPHGADANFTGGVCIHRRWTVRVARILKHFTNETSDFYISNSHDSGSELFVTGRFRRLVDLHPGLLRRLSDLSYQTGLT